MARMMQLHDRLVAGAFPNCNKLSTELEVSPKTIQRDIDFMRDQLGLPIQYDQLKFGFYYTERVTHFPTMKVSEGEVVALFVAQKSLEQYRGTPFEKTLLAAFQKISAGLRDQIDFQWEDLGSTISFRGVGTTVADLQLFEAVSRAVLKSREIEFEYKKLKGARYEVRRIQPYHLASVENQWYLFGHDLVRQQLRTFALPRMRALRETGARFQRPADFSIAEHLSQSFGVFTGTGGRTGPASGPAAAAAAWRVRIRFEGMAARLVSERQWHPSQKLKWTGEETLELALTLSSLHEVERWILSWGENAVVLDPPELADRIRSVGAALARRR